MYCLNSNTCTAASPSCSNIYCLDSVKLHVDPLVGFRHSARIITLIGFRHFARIMTWVACNRHLFIILKCSMQVPPSALHGSFKFMHHHHDCKRNTTLGNGLSPQICSLFTEIRSSLRLWTRSISLQIIEHQQIHEAGHERSRWSCRLKTYVAGPCCVESAPERLVPLQIFILAVQT